MAYYVPQSENVGGHVPRVPQKIAPMLSSASKLNHYRHFAIKCKYFKVIITIKI